MDESTQHKLEELRTTILNDLMASTADLGAGGVQEIETLLLLGRTSGDVRFLERAVHCTEKLENEDQRTNLLVKILGDIELALGSGSKVGASEEDSEQPAQQDDQQ